MYFILLIILLFFNKIDCYSIPEPKIVLLSPKGFQISIPNEDGVKLFVIHLAVNRKLNQREVGDFSIEKLKPSSNGRWTYQNLDIELKHKDIIYYWIYVQYENRGFELSDQMIRISTKMISKLESPIADEDIDFFRKPVSKGGANVPQCTISPTKFNGASVCQGKLIFEEKFESKDLNPNIWEHEIKFGGTDEDFVMFVNDKNVLYIANKHLVIHPNLTINSGYDSLRKYDIDLGKNCTENVNALRDCRRDSSHFSFLPPIMSAKIRSKKSFSFRYGRVEIRAKLPKGNWLFPQIFLEPKENFYGNEYESGQIRIAFIRGNENLRSKSNELIGGRLLMGGVILTKSQVNRNLFMERTQRTQHLGDDFHKYGLVWTSDNITLLIDNNEYGTILFSDFSSTLRKETINKKLKLQWNNGTLSAPFDQEFYISLGVSAGGISDFPDESRISQNEVKPWRNTDVKCESMFWKDQHKWYDTWKSENVKMKVDYVRVLAL